MYIFIENMDPMVKILNQIDDVLYCQRCDLKISRKNVVVGAGTLEAKILFIGEAPGRSEDLKGQPFVGSAGRILNTMLEQNGMKREEIYITNVVKCRPPENRVPRQDERDACHPYLQKQLEVIKPKLIVLLGKTASETMLGRKVEMGDEHGKVVEHEGLRFMVTYHPASVIYNRKLLPTLEEDFKKISAFAAG